MARKHARKPARKGGKKRGHRKSFAPSANKRGEMMVNRTSARLHNVVASHYLTRLEYGFTGSLTLGAGVQSYFNVWANGLTFPGDHLFNVGDPVTNFLDFSSGGAGGTLYPATEILTALNPVGYTALGNLYNKYRVMASKIDVTVSPNTTDMLLTLLPLSGYNLAVAGVPGADIQRAQSCPYAKAITCSPNNNIKQNRLSMYMDNPTIVGYTKRQYMDDPQTSAVVDVSNPPGTALPEASGSYSQVLWQVNYSPFTAGATVSANIEVRVTYTCEFFDPVTPQDV